MSSIIIPQPQQLRQRWTVQILYHVATKRNIPATVSVAATCPHDAISNVNRQRQRRQYTHHSVDTKKHSISSLIVRSFRHLAAPPKQWNEQRIRRMWSSSSSIMMDGRNNTNNNCQNTTTAGFKYTTTTTTIRTLSSSSNQSGKKKKNLFENTFGLTFSVSPEQALSKFITWAQTEQGLNTYIMNPSTITIVAVYCPVWSFDMNMRFIISNTKTGRKRLDWKPDIFQVYGKQSVIHLPGLSAYSGYTYRRTLIDPLHSTTLVFMNDAIVPFGAWMLRDMTMGSTGKIVPVIPDPWNAPQGRALAVVKEGLESLAGPSQDEVVRVQAEVVASRRVYMPTYAIQYSILGIEYQAFVSGCDEGAFVSGVSHKIFDTDPTTLIPVSTTTTGYLSTAIAYVQSGIRLLGGRQIGTLLLVALQLFGRLAARLLIQLPLIGAIGGVFVGFRKILRPWMDHRSASAEWERQREREASPHGKIDHIDDFTDTGTAQRYFQANRERILRNFAGTSEHGEGTYNWYSDWEKWARQQWEQQQQQQQQQQGYSQQQQQQQQQQPRQQKARQRAEYVWDFDPNDPYAVLGIKRGATAVEVSAAFRKQMMQHHPDTNSSGSEAEKARAIERSKLITLAYRTIKSQMKR